MESKENISKYIRIVVILSVFMFIFQQVASGVGGSIASLFDYSLIDKDNTFMWLSVHHIIQMIIAYMGITYLNRVFHLDFGLKFRKSKVGIKYTAFFILAMLIYVLVMYMARYSPNSITPFSYPLNKTNIIGTLGFLSLLSGVSEEILFRALPITLFSYMLNYDKNDKALLVIVSSAALFSIAHIQWTLIPFTIVANWVQLLSTFILGIIYGITFRKTNSIIYPMIMHSMGNVLMVGIGYLFAILG